MRRKKLVTLIGSICLVLVLAALTFIAACPAPSDEEPIEPTDEEPIELKVANYFPSVAAQSIILEEFCRELEERTNGRVEITYYPGGALVEAPTMFEGIVEGIADIGFGAVAYTPGRFPVSEVWELPLGFPSGWVTTHCVYDFYQQFKPKEWDEVKVLWVSGTGPSVIISTKPVRELEDLRGLILRAHGGQGRILTALGGTPATAPIGEVSEGIVKGVYDGVFIPIETLKVFKFAEVADFTTLTWQTGPVAPFYTVMNKNSWDKLPPDIQAIFDEVCEQFIERYASMWNTIDLEGIEFALEQGVELIELPPSEAARWVKAAEPVIDDYIANMVDAGYSESEIRGWIEFLQERIDYWAAEQIDRQLPSATGFEEVK